jgi:GAF domain-containing protein
MLNRPEAASASAASEPAGLSYLGVPLVEATGTVIGNLAVLDRRPMPEEPRALAIIQIFAARAGAEIWL